MCGWGHACEYTVCVCVHVRVVYVCVYNNTPIGPVKNTDRLCLFQVALTLTLQNFPWDLSNYIDSSGGFFWITILQRRSECLPSALLVHSPPFPLLLLPQWVVSMVSHVSGLLCSVPSSWLRVFISTTSLVHLASVSCVLWPESHCFSQGSSLHFTLLFLILVTQLPLCSFRFAGSDKSTAVILDSYTNSCGYPHPIHTFLN